MFPNVLQKRYVFCLYVIDFDMSVAITEISVIFIKVTVLQLFVYMCYLFIIVYNCLVIIMRKFISMPRWSIMDCMKPHHNALRSSCILCIY